MSNDPDSKDHAVNTTHINGNKDMSLAKGNDDGLLAKGKEDGPLAKENDAVPLDYHVKNEADWKRLLTQHPSHPLRKLFIKADISSFGSGSLQKVLQIWKPLDFEVTEPFHRGLLSEILVSTRETRSSLSAAWFILSSIEDRKTATQILQSPQFDLRGGCLTVQVGSREDHEFKESELIDLDTICWSLCPPYRALNLWISTPTTCAWRASHEYRSLLEFYTNRVQWRGDRLSTLIESLQRSCPLLQELHLISAGITDEDLSFLTPLVKQSNTLEILNLRGNPFHSLLPILNAVSNNAASALSTFLCRGDSVSEQMLDEFIPFLQRPTFPLCRLLLDPLALSDDDRREIRVILTEAHIMALFKTHLHRPLSLYLRIGVEQQFVTTLLLCRRRFLDVIDPDVMMKRISVKYNDEALETQRRINKKRIDHYELRWMSVCVFLRFRSAQPDHCFANSLQPSLITVIQRFCGPRSLESWSTHYKKERLDVRLASLGRPLLANTRKRKDREHSGVSVYQDAVEPMNDS